MRCFSFASAVVLAFFASTPALANGRFPKANQLVVAPGAPDTLSLRTTFGILFSSDRGANWDWVCENAVGYPPNTNEDPSIGITANKSVVVGLYEGISVSPDTGCAWKHIGGALDKEVIVDIVVRPDDPHTIFGLTSTYVTADDAGAAIYNARLFGTTDDGTSWAPVGVPIDPSVLSETVEVAKSNPHRFYISAVKGAGATATGLLYVSDNDGATWTERQVPLDPMNERAPFIAAVDPTNADRVYVRTGGGSTSSRLLVTDDAGMTFRAVYTGMPMLGFALSPDGSKIFLGGADGLFTANKTDLTFTKQSSIIVQCLATSGTTLYACSSESSGFILGASEDDGATFVPKLHLSTVRGPLACPSTTEGSACVMDWPTLRDSLGAGGSDAGDDAGPVVVPPGDSGKGCGCAIAGVPSEAWGGALFLGLAVAVITRWRTRKAPAGR
ncbi:MAG: MYXO-CTERM sorting domain-containing protein [Polyangiaceae bacterium]